MRRHRFSSTWLRDADRIVAPAISVLIFSICGIFVRIADELDTITTAPLGKMHL